MASLPQLSGDDEFEHQSPDLPRLFTDAALYEKYLGEIASLNGNLAPEAGKGFADLVAGDLSPSDRAIAGRFATLSVTGDSWLDQSLSLEPESHESAVDKNDTQTQGSTPVPSIRVANGQESWRISPDEVVDLMIQEFGPLAVEGEEEKLIIEADGALVDDVVILGVMHLTTHRLAFHASLLSSRPDLSASQQIIKAGWITIHQKGWRKKHKVWTELCHDMLSSYASSREEDRIRPIRSVLYSNIEEVVPMDPAHPRIIVLKFANEMHLSGGHAEFDTEESAREWRKEISGALFLYRHRRHAFMVNDGKNDLDGIRISVPLSKIDHIDEGNRLAFTYFLSVYLPKEFDAPYDDFKKNKLQFGTIRPEAEWRRLEHHITVAKGRNSPNVASNIVLDFGPLSFSPSYLHSDIASVVTPTDKEMTIRLALALGDEPRIWYTRARIRRTVSSAGYFVVTPHLVCFWSKMTMLADIRYRLIISTVKSANSVGPNFLQHNGLRLVVEGQGDLEFDFKTAKERDIALTLINQASASETQFWPALPSFLFNGPPTPLTTVSPTSIWNDSGDSSDSNVRYIPHTPTRSATAILAPLSRALSKATSIDDPDGVRKTTALKVINIPQGTLFARAPMHFVCLTIGSRGDVQPYIALGKGLQQQGHRVSIVTHEEYREWVEGFGIEHRTAGGDPGALMKLSVEHKMFSPDFFKESLTNFRKWLDELLVDAWEQCQGADVLLESPSAMAGVHIAEALTIPYFRCFTMPWTKTTSFPHAFLSPPVESPTFNSASYVLFDNVMWTATSGQINRWRRNTMKIGRTDMTHLAQSRITFIYNFSIAVVPKPLDWTDTTIISGYWFLDNPDIDWTPPPSLIEWMANARKDGKAIVYIGFGSITVPNPNTVTEILVKAVLNSGVRAILSKGWSARMSKKSDEQEPKIPPECYQLDKVPHDWLFPQIDAALHHGGAGTTGASLRAGIPTLIKPWFGDQFFWASRVHKLGAGLKVPHLRVNDVADALIRATTSRQMKEKAASVGEKIRSEDGVRTAIHAIYTYMDRASRDRASLD